MEVACVIPEAPRSFQMSGMDMEVPTNLRDESKLHSVLRKHARWCRYRVLFEIPTYWDDAERKDSKEERIFSPPDRP